MITSLALGATASAVSPAAPNPAAPTVTANGAAFVPPEGSGVNEKKGGNRKKGVVSDKKERRGTTPNAIRVYRERAAKRSAVSLS